MKKAIAFIIFAITVIAVLGLSGVHASAATAAPTASKVLVNGRNIAFDAYNINDNNYFMLRDLAYALSGTEKQFDVEYWEVEDTIVLTAGEKYTIVGGEMAGGAGFGIKNASPTKSTLFYVTNLEYFNAKELDIAAYNIGGYNYFKLRDIGRAIGFSVEWDEARDTIAIDTSKPYIPDPGELSGPTPTAPPTTPSAGTARNDFYAGVLHDFMKAKDKNGYKDAAKLDLDGCGGDELIIVCEGKPEADDFWASYAIGFGIWVFDSKYPKNGGASFESDEITISTYVVYVSKKNEIVLYDSFEGEAYRVFKYSGGALKETLVLVNAEYGWDSYYEINGAEATKAQLQEKLKDYDVENPNNIASIIAKGTHA